MQGEIEHNGIVQKVTEEKITIKIISESACASCHAKEACLASDKKEKEIEVFRFSGGFIPGQEVKVIGKLSQGIKAVVYGYILPFVVVFAILIIINAITKNEALSGILAICSLVPYFLVLYLFRNKMKKQFEFEIKPIQ